MICAGCTLGFKQLIGKEGNVRQRYFHEILAGLAVTSETRAGCRLSSNFYFGAPIQELCFTSVTAVQGGNRALSASDFAKSVSTARAAASTALAGAVLLGGIGVAVYSGPWTVPSKVSSLSECGNGKAAP